MKKIMIIGAVGALLMTSCSSDEPNGNSANSGKNKWEYTTTLSLNADENLALEALDNFNYELTNNYAEAIKDDNFAVSPISVSICMSMLANASDGETRAQLLSLLNSNDLATLNSLNSKLMHYLPAEKEGVCLDINNRYWVAKRWKATKETTAALKNNFNAEIEYVDFTKETTVPAINNWINEKTKGLIDKLLDAPWDAYIAFDMVTANTIYFKGDWSSKFDKSKTDKQTFHGLDCDKQVDMMHKKSELYHAKTDQFEMVSLPYKGGESRMEIYLPTEGLSIRELVRLLTPEVVADAREKKYIKEVTLSMPRFSCENNSYITDILNAMGLQTGRPDFTPLGILEKGPMTIVHKTSVKIDEDGTELAAVTGSGMSSAPGPFEYEKVTMTLDRPFLYRVTDNHGTLLLVGSVVNP